MLNICVLQDFSLTIFLREYWVDPRLGAINATQRTILKGNDVDLIWLPDIFFINEKSAKMHDVTVQNKLINIRPNGSIWLSLRYYFFKKKQTNKIQKTALYRKRDELARPTIYLYPYLVD